MACPGRAGQITVGMLRPIAAGTRQIGDLVARQLDQRGQVTMVSISVPPVVAADVQGLALGGAYPQPGDSRSSNVSATTSVAL